ncbi:ACP S-malonyltransferase [Paenibacillus amylolyticus]|uniref:ACP S-malonyltransferase n=1 Tax=Paenibacillus amylolyticus TaxID=1451 RepID=UPI00249A050D|nr:ACP S-malonyltransferase [Paenibacillus amylolyticus]WFA85543.1 ACP S-malonyltransferase [Paenibacillus amylolyticus]
MHKTMILFPGQGAQFTGMGRALYDHYPIIKRTFDEASDILDFSVSNLCFSGTSEQLKRTINAQIAIFVLSVAAYRQLQNMHQLAPEIMGGHSLGEYSALASSGAASFEDLLRVVHYRAQVMEEVADSGNGAMFAVEYEVKGLQHIEQECADLRLNDMQIWIGAYNSDNQIVLTGKRSDLMSAETKWKERGYKVIPLQVSGAFHSPLMHEAGELLGRRLRTIEWSPPRCTIISNVTGQAYTGADCIVENLEMQLTKPVLWTKSMETAIRHGVTHLTSMPPKNIFQKMLQYIEGVNVHALSSVDDFENYQKNDESEIYNHLLSIAAGTRNYNKDVAEYDRTVVRAYKELEAIKYSFSSARGTAEDRIHRAGLLFLTILENKKIPLESKTTILHALHRKYNLRIESQG